MSARKRKDGPVLQDTFDLIKACLIRIKPKLDDVKLASRESLIDDLHQVASLAETFTELRPRSNKAWVHLVDTLDQEGVNLWNAAGLIRQTPEEDGLPLVGALRHAAFRLIEAGLEHKPGIDTILHVLQVASKTGATLSELGKKDVAASVLTCAAKFEDLLRNVEDPDGSHRQAKARVTVVYFSTRMEASWREGNEGVAELMLQKITEHDRLVHLPSHDRELLASKLHKIGMSILRGNPHHVNDAKEGVKAMDAVQWGQKAFTVIESLEDSATPGLSELKRSILRTLARAYFISSPQVPENLNRAETTLQELTTSIDASTDHANLDYQEVRWMRLAVLKRRKAGEATLLEAFKSIIDHMTFTESNVTNVLRDLRSLADQHTLVTAVNQYCLQKALLSPDKTGLLCVDRLLLSLIFICSKDDDHARAMRDLHSAFGCISEAGFELPRIPTGACLTLIWQYGDRHYHAKRWSEAAEWYLAGSHAIYQSMGQGTSSKCLRKAALCYIQQRQYASASAVIRRCSSNEASTHYVVFLTAIHQGLENEAITAIQDMVKAPDFDRNMLLLATQLSHESDMKNLLLTVLEGLLKTLKQAGNGDTVVEAMTLIRCIIRLIAKLLAEPAANKSVLIDALIGHFGTASGFIDEAAANKTSSLISKDVSWLWRTAYNCAVQGCHDWEECEEQISALFDISRELLEVHFASSPIDSDPELQMYIIYASFAAVSGRVFAARRAAGNMQFESFRTVLVDIKGCKERVSKINAKKMMSDDEILRIQSFLSVVHVFETEIFCQLKDWDALRQNIEAIARCDATAIATFESIADIVWSEQDCPINVQFVAFEAILHASLDQNSLSVEKFSRWLRALCTILLARNMPGDRSKAIGYIEQAIAVMEDSSRSANESGDAYPMDEKHWLLATAYNTAIDCLHGSMLEEAKRWFESSAVICRFVPNGKSRADKIMETYTTLLARYARQS